MVIILCVCVPMSVRQKGMFFYCMRSFKNSIMYIESTEQSTSSIIYLFPSECTTSEPLKLLNLKPSESTISVITYVKTLKLFGCMLAFFF